MNAVFKMKPADTCGSGRPMLSTTQEDIIDQARRTTSEQLRRNRAFVQEAILNNEELLNTIVAAYLAGDMRRAESSIRSMVEVEILDTFKRNEDDYDHVARLYREDERAMPRPVLPEVQS